MLKQFIQNANPRNLFKFALPWSTRRVCLINRSGNFPVFVQYSQFHQRFDYSNRNYGKIFKESKRYGDASKRDNLSKSMIQLAQQGRIDEAIDIFEKSKYRQDDCIKLTMINILVTADRLSSAKQLATTHKLTVESTPPPPPPPTTSSQANTILCSIFNSLVRQLDLNELNFFIEHLIFARKYVSRTVLEIIINGLLSKNVDIDVILNHFERMAKTYRETPLFQSIACELINRDDTERLDRLLSISTKIHGRINSLYSMAFALNACNRIDQAQKIFTLLGSERESELLEQCIANLCLRKQIKLLENLLVATKASVAPQYREQMFMALLELYAYKEAKDDITRICSAMDEEKIIPVGQMREKLTTIFKRNGINVPHSWRSTDVNAVIENSSEVQLQTMLNANDITGANDLFLKLLDDEQSLNRSSIRFCLSKNSEHANIEMFQHLTKKFDFNTRKQLKFHHFECAAYLNANKSQEYLEMIHTVSKGDQSDLKTIATQLPENVVDMIDSSVDIYKQYLGLATQTFADKGIMKPICIVWTYNFLYHKNPADNQAIWKKYLQTNETILCNVATRVLLNRRQTDRLCEFLNMSQLNKHRIVKAELGKTYSVLFDRFYHDANYEQIIVELKKMVPILSIKYLKSNTLNRLKFGPPEFKEQFWCVVNNAK